MFYFPLVLTEQLSSKGYVAFFQIFQTGTDNVTFHEEGRESRKNKSCDSLSMLLLSKGGRGSKGEKKILFYIKVCYICPLHCFGIFCLIYIHHIIFFILVFCKKTE